MTNVLERERIEVRPPEIETSEPQGPRFGPWSVWLVVGLGLLIAAVVVGLLLNTKIGGDADLASDEAASTLSIGDRQLDPTFVIPERWVGTSLEGTLEDELAAAPRSLDDYALRHMPPAGAEFGMTDDYATRHMPASGPDFTMRDDYATRHMP